MTRNEFCKEIDKLGVRRKIAWGYVYNHKELSLEDVAN